MTLPSGLGPNNILEVENHPGTPAEAREVAALAHGDSATVVAIISHATSSLIPLAHYVLLGVIGAEHDLQPASTGSRMSQLATIDALFIIDVRRTDDRSHPFLARSRNTGRTHHEEVLEGYVIDAVAKRALPKTGRWSCRYLDTRRDATLLMRGSSRGSSNGGEP